MKTIFYGSHNCISKLYPNSKKVGSASKCFLEVGKGKQDPSELNLHTNPCHEHKIQNNKQIKK